MANLGIQIAGGIPPAVYPAATDMDKGEYLGFSLRACVAGTKQGDVKGRQASAAADSDEDDWDTGRGGNKKKKGGRKKPSAKQKAAPPVTTQTSKAKQG